MASKTRVIRLNGEEVSLTGETTVTYAGQEWVVEKSSFGPCIGPHGEIGYQLLIEAWLKDCPMPESVLDEYKLATSLSNEATQGAGDTSNVPIHA